MVTRVKSCGDIFWDQCNVCMSNRISVHPIRTHQAQLVNCFSIQRETNTICRKVFSQPIISQNLVYIEQKILLLISVAGLPTLPIILLTKLQFRRSVAKKIYHVVDNLYSSFLSCRGSKIN